jgi:hypothetical protein
LADVIWAKKNIKEGREKEENVKEKEERQNIRETDVKRVKKLCKEAKKENSAFVENFS